MTKPIVKCPVCGSINTREYHTGIHLKNSIYNGFCAFDDEHYKYMDIQFPDSCIPNYDYYCAANICDSCNKSFFTKNKIEIQVIETEILEE